ncbi:MAG: hypothetical protein JNM59_01340 [Hyphomonadaceae bacterium]|nr:hypothetical protein [Hyphomonadaceae bacterium]
MRENFGRGPRALTQIAFFGHDARDPAVQRRIGAFMRAGAEVCAFTMRRGAETSPAWRNVDLGETRDAAFGQRIQALWRARSRLRVHAQDFGRAELFYARNLDMLWLARWARRMSASRARLVYECLDVHRFMTRGDALGAGMRALERSLLREVDLVVVSSPAFASEYFDRFQPGRARTMLVENRMPRGFDYGDRPRTPLRADGALRIGWFGNLRCKRSLELLLGAASALPDRVSIVMRGAPARTELADFEGRIAAKSNASYLGRYAWPNDLAAIYEDVDVVWAGDFHDPGANSKWLLPNRLYEGGYYATPPVAPRDCQTGRWIEDKGFGFTLPEPLERTLPEFLATISRDAVAHARARMQQAPEDVFVQPDDELQRVIEAAMSAPARD